MRRIRRVISGAILAAIAFAARAAVPLDPERHAAALIELLQSGTGVPRDRFASGLIRMDVRDTIESLHCADVERYGVRIEESTAGTALLRVFIEGTGLTAQQRRVPLPSEWLLGLRRDSGRWLIASAETADQAMARALRAAAGDEERRSILAAEPQRDRAEVARAMALQILGAGRLGGHRGPGDYEAALFARALAEDSGNPRAKAVATRVAAFMASLSALPGTPLLETSLKEAEASGDCDAVAAALFAIANGRLWGGGEGGVDLMQRAASMMDRLDNPRIALRALHNLAVFQTQVGDLNGSVTNATKLARLAARYDWTEGVADAFGDLGEIYMQVGRDDLAIDYERRAFELQESIGNEYWATTMLLNWAEAERRLGHTDRTIALYDRIFARQIRPVDRVTILLSHARALAQVGRLREADRKIAEAFQQAPEINWTLMPEAAEVRLAEGRYEDALRYVSMNGVTTDDPDPWWRGYTIRGRALRHLGRRREAIEALRSAIDIIEQHRATLPPDVLARERYFAERIEPYHELIDILAAAGQARTALAVAERAKARILLDAFSLGRRNLTRSIGEEDLRRRTLLQSEISQESLELLDRRSRSENTGAVEARLSESRLALAHFNTELAWRYPAAPAPPGEVDPPAPAEMDPDLTVIEYAVSPRSMTVLVVSRRGVQARRVPVRKEELLRVVGALEKSLAERRLDYRGNARRAYELLIEPVAPWLRRGGALCIVPDGALWRVPFQVLAGPDGEPLLARHPIFYAPSLAMLRQGTSRVRGKETLLALGNPAQALAALPDAEREVETIAHLYGSRAEALVGGMANEKCFKRDAPHRDVLHIAAHALIDDQWPWYSALLLARDGANDGLLEAQELLQLDLHSDLAVLSACDTGRGRVLPGEGVIGLSWALLAAGCRTTVVSLWPVASAASSDLMIALHRAYLKGETPSEALRTAQLALRRDKRYAHPFYWAGFVVIGGR